MQNFTITVDDTSPVFHYSPLSAWHSATPQENANLTFYFQNTATYTNTSEANVTFEFWGNSVQIYGSKNQDHSEFKVQIDDRVFDSSSGYTNSSAGFQQRLFEKSGLPSGRHTVVMTNMQEGKVVEIDFVTWETAIVNDDDIAKLQTISDDSQDIVYSGSWGTSPSHLDFFFGGTGHETRQPGSFFEYTFTGTAMAIYGPADPSGAPYTVQIDNSTSQNYSFHTPRYVPQSLLFFHGNMSAEEHTVRVTHAGMDSNNNTALAIDFMNVYSSSKFEIRATMASGGASKSTIAAIVMGVVVGLLFFFIALLFVINRGRKLGQLKFNIFYCDSWGRNKKTEVAGRVRREGVTEGFELDGGEYATVMTAEARNGRNDPGIALSAASVTSGDDSEMGLISITPRRNDTSDNGSSTAHPGNNNKQRWSFSGLSALNQPLVIPKSSMGIIGVDGATSQVNFPSGHGGQRNLSTVPASMPIPLPPGLAGTSGSVLEGSKQKRRETVLSRKRGPEYVQSSSLEVPPPQPLPESSQPGSEESHVVKEEVLRTPKVDSVSLATNSRTSRHASDVSDERIPSLKIHQSGSEGSLPLRSLLPESDGGHAALPSPSERSTLSIGQAELLLHRIPIMPASPSGVGTGMTGTTEGTEMPTPTSGRSARSSFDVTQSRRSSFGGGSTMSPRSPRERPRGGNILGPRMRSPKTPPLNYKRGKELGESSGGEKKDEGEMDG